MSTLEDLLALQIHAAALPQPERQYPFAKSLGRKWRADFCWVKQKLIAECQGMTWQNGRHTRGAGYAADCERLNTAVVDLGYQVVYFTADMIHSGAALAVLRRALESGVVRHLTAEVGRQIG